MISKDKRPGDAAGLRKHVETITREKAVQSQEDIKDLSPDEMREKLHELQMHQIELEMKNKELCQALDAECESEKRFRLLFMNAPMPYQSLDENGNFLDVNQTFLDVMGYSREELIGRNFGDFLDRKSVV